MTDDDDDDYDDDDNNNNNNFIWCTKNFKLSCYHVRFLFFERSKFLLPS